MTSYREALFGIPEHVLDAVNTDIESANRGPRALKAAHEDIDREECLARYHAVLSCLAYDRTMHTHTAAYAFTAEQARAERTQDRSWSA